MVVSQLPKLKARVRFPSPAFILLFAFLGGCATTEYKPLPSVEASGAKTTPAAPVPVTVEPIKKQEPTYHKVAKGQTLYRIAKAYGVQVEDVIKVNNIPNAGAIEVGQLIMIPGAQAPQDLSARAPDENKEEFAWPLKGKISTYFNDRRGDLVSRGIDIDANEGETVKASREGNVIMADYLAGYGNTLMIDHGDGLISVYAQNKELLTKLGDHVYKGDPVALVGKIGKKSYLHFELRKGEAAVNPMYYLP